MSDMLVKLYALEYKDLKNELSADGISVKKACIVDKDVILKFVRDNFKDETVWANECEYALFNTPVFNERGGLCLCDYWLACPKCNGVLQEAGQRNYN